ncbi:hypothetical protein [Aeromicrobium duanguangcaii]|uniref:Uncharacterized protein n=1 Tax=Aeromicrobium duanguangcaii TaxID=2968086 RepID=A0ABY5KD64_9ACTN|nr:hypothetical protein [Aeromicrobium duanguangcaii]MCD9154542.1 hypothetical protein [Aeromicrobium duanguangcaii]MCL3838292.1 hypothetical protein [Aeromicrobium duanguangcaii]UUI68402.1 hypothetical protein NP095_14510 [Aeromicrobium duanguangcaii]
MSALLILLSVVITLVFGLFAVGAVLLLVRATNTPASTVQQPGWQGAPRPPSVAGSGSWNAEVMSDGLVGMAGGSLRSTFGRFDLRDGVLAFTPNGEIAPAWQVRCADLTVTRHGVLSQNAVTLQGPMGVVRCSVSIEHINRFSRNSIKTMRQASYATAFVQVLRAHGARG